MNKRIKELAEQATNWCEKSAQGTPVAWEWENKFAELIVKECANEVTLSSDYDHLLLHFGIYK